MTTENLPLDGDSTAGERPPARCRLGYLKINRFRDVRPGTHLRFDEGLNVFLGRNGTGKTTLLELICALASGDVRAYEKEAFDLEFEAILGGLTYQVKIQNLPVASHVAQISGDQGLSWRYHLTISGLSHTPFAIIEVPPRGGRDLNAPVAGSVSDFEGYSLFSHGYYLHQPLQQIGHAECLKSVMRYYDDGLRSCLRLDEGLDVFRCITSGVPLPRVEQPLSVRVSSAVGIPGMPPQIEQVVNLRHFLDRVRKIYVPATVFLQVSEQGDVHGRTEIRLAMAEQEFMARAAAALQAKEILCTMKLLRREQGKDPGSPVSVFGQPSFWITTQRGVTYSHDQLSYGEKRLLAFLYHAAANPEILVADELVNGLHHEWIQTCLDAIQGQAFLTSQNPLLLDHLPFSSAEEVQRRFVLCDRDDQGNWIWRNMDPDEADSFYRAYEVGLQHVSEILETKGLW